jgi:Flp pilus assembly protein TadG
MNFSHLRMDRRLGRYLRKESGAAAAELAIVLPILTIPLLNVVDLGVYAYQQMQLENAAVAGAEAVRSFCNSSTKKPATIKCTGYATAVTTAIQSTSLGSGVSQVGSLSEAYYCTTTAGVLVQVAAASATPAATCSTYTGYQWSSASAAPSDYVQVSVSYSYTPVFRGLSVTSFFPQSITKTTWSRLS